MWTFSTIETDVSKQKKKEATKNISRVGIRSSFMQAFVGSYLHNQFLMPQHGYVVEGVYLYSTHTTSLTFDF